MTFQAIVFPTPSDAHCELRLDDSGEILIGVQAVHPTGRPGQGFTIPDGTPDGHGATWTTSAPKKATVVLHGVLWLKQPVSTLDVDTVVLPDQRTSGRAGVVRLA